jgi:hypothetical protein
VKKLSMLAVGAAGYVLGSRAGRERYEQIKTQATKLWNQPTVQKTVDDVQAQAKSTASDVGSKAASKAAEVANDAKSKVTEKVKGSDEGTTTPTPTTTTTTTAAPTAGDYVPPSPAATSNPVADGS